FAQELEVAAGGHGQRIERWRFALATKAAALETLQRAGVVRVDPGDDVFGAHVEEGELQTFPNGASAKPLPPAVVVSNDQDDFTVRACLDQTDKADGGIVAIVSHKETAAL